MDIRRNRKRTLWTIATLIVLLAGFAARTIDLDRHPLWWDESISLYLGSQGPAGIVDEIRSTHDTDPPLYRLALGGWTRVAGTSPFALRFFSALPGALLPALTMLIGRWLTGRRPVALLAALLVALAPMQIYYAREAKGYAFAAVWALLSVYVWGRKLGYLDARPAHTGSSLPWWAIYVLSVWAMLGTHYYLGLLVLWQGMWTAGSAVPTLARRSPAQRAARLRLGRWVLAASVVAIPLALWTWVVLGSTMRGARGLSQWDPLSLWEYLQVVGGELSIGPVGEEHYALLAGAGLAISLAVGALAPGRRAFLVTWICVPLACAYLLQRVYSFFSPRFLLYLGPPCCLLIARGVGLLQRRWTAAVAAGPLILTLALWPVGLEFVYARPIDRAEDPRPAIEHVRRLADPGDAVLTTYIWQEGYFASYAPNLPLTFYRNPDSAETASQFLDRIFDTHPHVWVISYMVDVRDRNHPFSTWLQQNSAQTLDVWYGKTQLGLFVRSPAPPATWPASASFASEVGLNYVPLDVSLQPGDVLSVLLSWHAAGALDRPYKVFVHLRETESQPVAQSDGEPASGQAPTTAWQAGQPVIDRRALLIPRETLQGAYQVYVGLYDPSSGERLPLLSPAGCDTPDSLCIGRVHIAAGNGAPAP